MDADAIVKNITWWDHINVWWYVASTLINYALVTYNFVTRPDDKTNGIYAKTWTLERLQYIIFITEFVLVNLGLLRFLGFSIRYIVKRDSDSLENALHAFGYIDMNLIGCLIYPWFLDYSIFHKLRNYNYKAKFSKWSTGTLFTGYVCYELLLLPSLIILFGLGLVAITVKATLIPLIQNQLISFESFDATSTLHLINYVMNVIDVLQYMHSYSTKTVMYSMLNLDLRKYVQEKGYYSKWVIDLRISRFDLYEVLRTDI